MKQAYSTYSTAIWKGFKTCFPRADEQEFPDFGTRLWCSMAKPQSGGGRNWGQDCVYMELLLEFLWRFRTVSHYFLAPGVADFCVSCAKNCSGDYFKPLPPCVPVAAPCAGREFGVFPLPLSFFSKGGEGEMQGGFAVHFPAKERQRSMMMVPDALTPIHKIDWDTGRKFFLRDQVVASDGDGVIILNPSEFSQVQELGESDAHWKIKLILGLSLYMDAFPDAVVDAGAESIHQVKHYTGPRHVVTRNAVMDEETRNGVSPHWRRGHFRVLSAPRFIHKSGMTVYVRGAFVKGAAFDVLADAPAKGGAL